MIRFFNNYNRENKDPIILDLEKTQFELAVAYSKFENVVDPDLIDATIYEVNAVSKRYCFFLKQAKILQNKPLEWEKYKIPIEIEKQESLISEAIHSPN